MLSIDELHERILYPVVRVRAKNAGGSGVLVYSKPDPKDPKKYINVCLTAEHVISELIKIKEEWDPVLKRDVKTDHLEEAVVEVFDYDGSHVVSANATPAEIIAYDKAHDLAALRLRTPRPMPYVATIIPEAEIANLQLFEPVWTCGCSLLHDPFANPGTLTYLREMIEQKEYIMSNSAGVFGNSGGGLFRGKDGTLLGLVCRLTGIQLGFGIDLMTWMIFSTHPRRLYEFLRHHELHFLFDDSDDYYAAAERREKRRKESLRELLLGEGEAKKK
jgi:hypothetical protein